MATVAVSPTVQRTVAVVQAAPNRVAIVHAGPRGAAGADGAAQDFEHVQSGASAEWIINHNFGYEPLVSVLSPGGVEMEASIVHVSTNQVRVYFASAQAGRARCV